MRLDKPESVVSETRGCDSVIEWIIRGSLPVIVDSERLTNIVYKYGYWIMKNMLAGVANGKMHVD